MTKLNLLVLVGMCITMQLLYEDRQNNIGIVGDHPISSLRLTEIYFRLQIQGDQKLIPCSRTF